MLSIKIVLALSADFVSKLDVGGFSAFGKTVYISHDPFVCI